MSKNPTTSIAERRRFIAERSASIQAELDALTAEAAELDIADRVLKRFSQIPTIGGNGESHTARVESIEDDEADADADGPTLPQMVFTMLGEAKARGLKGAESAEMLKIIRARWKPDFTAEKLRPTLWRMVQKGRLKKRGKIYRLPDSSPEGETEAVGASARH